MVAPLDNAIALRVGLAARALPDTDVRTLLRVLIKIMGEPITESKLQKLRARRLRYAHHGALAKVDEVSFRKAFALLKGQGVPPLPDSRPELPCGGYCEVMGSLKVACASNSGEKIDGAFSRCTRYLIYQVSPQQIKLIDIREPAAVLPSRERDRVRAGLLQDCAVLYTTSIGAPSAAKLVGIGLHPIRIGEPADAAGELARLQQVLAQDSPPPWLSKAMGFAPNMRPQYEEVGT